VLISQDGEPLMDWWQALNQRAIRGIVKSSPARSFGSALDAVEVLCEFWPNLRRNGVEQILQFVDPNAWDSV
jgi:hypothetical protein